MLVIARGNFLFRANGENYLLKRGVLTSVPSWVAAEPFFKALCNEGRIAISETTKDSEVEKKVEEAEVKEQAVKKTRKKTSK